MSYLFYVLPYIIIPSPPLDQQHPEDKNLVLLCQPYPPTWASHEDRSLDMRGQLLQYTHDLLGRQRLKTQNYRNVSQAAMCSWPCLDSRYRCWTPKPALIHFGPSHSNNTIILTSAFTSCSTLLGIFESHPRTQSGFFFFFFPPGRCHGKSLLVKQ